MIRAVAALTGNNYAVASPTFKTKDVMNTRVKP